MDRANSTRRPLRLVVVAVAVTFTVLAAGCGSDDSSTDDTTSGTDLTQERLVEAGTPQSGGKVVFGLQADSDGYNPAVSRFSEPGHFVASAIYDTLAAWDADGNAVPFFASSIEPLDDEATEWEIKIPAGRTFHNGDPADAPAIATTLNQYRDGLVTSGAMTNVESIEAPDAETVIVRTNAPWAQFPTLLTTQVGYVAAPSMFSDPDSAAHPVGTGPFVFESWIPEESLNTLKWENYWGEDENGTQLPYLDELEFQFIADETGRLSALQRGDIDIMHTINPTTINLLKADTDLQYIEYRNGPEDLVTLDTASPPFDNEHARRALALATDQPRFLDEIQQGAFPAANTPFGPGQLGYREDVPYPTYDLEAAKEEVELYKQETGADALRFTYLGAAGDPDGLAAQNWLITEWAKAGIEASIEQVPQATLIFRVVTRDYQASDWRNWAQPDPDPDFQWWHSSSVRPREEGLSLNVSHFQDPEIDAALETARASSDNAERDEAYAVVGRRLAEEVPYIFLGRNIWAIGATDSTHGFELGGENGSLATVGSKTPWMGQLWVN